MDAFLKNDIDNVKGKYRTGMCVCVSTWVLGVPRHNSIIQLKSSEAIQTIKIVLSNKRHLKILDILMMPFAQMKHYPHNSRSSEKQLTLLAWMAISAIRVQQVRSWLQEEWEEQVQREDLSSGVRPLRNSLGTHCEFSLMAVLQNVETPCRNLSVLAQSLQALSMREKMHENSKKVYKCKQHRPQTLWQQ